MKPGPNGRSADDREDETVGAGQRCDYDTPGAISTDSNGRHVCVSEIAEPELLRIFEQTRIACFEAEPAGEECTVVRRVPDQDW